MHVALCTLQGRYFMTSIVKFLGPDLQNILPQFYDNAKSYDRLTMDV